MEEEIDRLVSYVSDYEKAKELSRNTAVKPPATLDTLLEEKPWDDLTGKDWSRLSPKGREEYVDRAIQSLSQENMVVVLARPSSEYVRFLDNQLTDPFFHKERLYSLFLFNVTRAEPQTASFVKELLKRSKN